MLIGPLLPPLLLLLLLLLLPPPPPLLLHHRYGVPYFKDSTPSWSTRGKLRLQLLPLLQEIYGSGCLRSLAALARESDLASALMQQNIYEPFMK